MSTRALRAESEALAERLVRCLPAASFEMETLVRLSGIEASREIATAAVGCGDRPRLLINPDFVATRCATDEHLFLLAMHELWHVLLAHTRTHPRATRDENVAFDAVINAYLCWQFPGVEYRGFFESLNRSDEFPGCLLRPPEGWPTRHHYAAAPGPKGTARILERLYGSPPWEGGEGSRRFWHRRDVPQHEEIVALLERAKRTAGSRAGASPFLLGDHEDPGEDARVVEDRRFSEIVRAVAVRWPGGPKPFPARGVGWEIHDRKLFSSSSAAEAARAFARIVKRALAPGRGTGEHVRRGVSARPGGVAPLPSARDRLVHARRALGLYDVLQVHETLVRTRERHRGAVTHVYADVSPSVGVLVPWVLGLVWPHVLAGEVRAFQFSTVVEPLTRRDLSEGRFKGTNGTDVACVIRHALAAPRIRSVLLVTDGEVGTPSAEDLAALAARRLAVHVALVGKHASAEDLEPIAASITRLPDLRDFGRPPS